VISIDPLKHVRHMMHTRGRTRARRGKFCVLVQEHSGEQEKVCDVTVTSVTVYCNHLYTSQRSCDVIVHVRVR
jgi:hypothetical protein